MESGTLTELRHLRRSTISVTLDGEPTALNTQLGAIPGVHDLNIKIWMTNAVALAFAGIFLVTRNGRAEEEAGRTELLRGGVLGQHAYSLANWVVAVGFSAAVGLLPTLVAIGLGLPIYGSLVMGTSFMGVGWAFIGVAAVAGQLAQTSRGANTIASVVLAAAYLIRAAAAVTWAIFGFLIVLSMFGDLFGLPTWVTDNTPFTAISRVDEPFHLLSLVVITVLALSLAALGLWRLNTRDMTGE